MGRYTSASFQAGVGGGVGSQGRMSPSPAGVEEEGVAVRGTRGFTSSSAGAAMKSSCKRAGAREAPRLRLTLREDMGGLLGWGDHDEFGPGLGRHAGSHLPPPYP